jgi:uncharacterized membrane protein
MKRALFIGLMALALGAAVYLACYRLGTRSMRKLTAQTETAWLVHEFQLNPEQAQRIAQLESGYEPRCMEMCRKIAENRARLDALISSHRERTPEMDTLLRESADIQMECRKEMLSHIYEIARAMSPEQASRYLFLMKLQVLQPGTSHTFVLRHEHE